MFNIKMKLVLLPAAAVLVACGGGGSPANEIVKPTSDFTLSGVAATGAAFVGAEVFVTDKTGTVVGKSELVGSDGKFTVSLKSTTQAPYVLTASRTTTSGEIQSLVSVAASEMDIVVNITPITHLIASRLSPSGDPSKLSAELASQKATITSTTVNKAVNEIAVALKPLLTATGTQDQNLLNAKFSVDGTGFDRLLDSIDVSIVPSSSNSSNVAISVKQKLVDGAQPPTINFASNVSELPPLPAIDINALVEDGTAGKVSNLMANLTACYAVPFEDRVNGVTSNAMQDVKGSANDVKSPACRSIFLDNNPAEFLSNGGKVGRDASNSGAFASLFRRGATGVIFSDGAFEYATANGDLVISYKARASNGDENFDVFVVRKDDQKNLKLIGNQYQFPGGVAAFQQRRNFISLNQSSYDYLSTGYALNVPNLTTNGEALFNRVVVTSPLGNTLVLRPNGGISFLTLVKNDDPTFQDIKGTLTPTNFIRLRSEYLTGTKAKQPSEIDSSLFFANIEWTESQLSEATNTGAWKYEYYLATDPTKLAATQYFRTRARALSISELKTQGLASLTSAFIAELSASTKSDGPDVGRIILKEDQAFKFETSTGGDGWSVEKKQLPPILLSVFGRMRLSEAVNTLPRYNDETAVAANARKGTADCKPQNDADLHCVNGGPNHKAGSTVDSLQLFTRNTKGREFGSLYGMYPLTLQPGN